MPIDEVITTVLNCDLAVENIQRERARAPGQKQARALACARTKLDEARHWLRDALGFVESGE